MIKSFFKTLSLAGLMFSALPCFSQRAVSVSATVEYVVPEDVSKAQARKTAVERARQKALEDQFGTSISLTNVTNVTNSNGVSNVSFHSYGLSNVRGEWLQDTKEPSLKYSVDERSGQDIITVTVWGKARERRGSKVQLQVKTLRNGTDDSNEATSFDNGDDLYVSFLCPTDGYVAIYLADESEAYCLFPYASDGGGSAPVAHGKRHVFFSQASVPAAEAAKVVEYNLTTERTQEANNVYVLFSTQKFPKANCIDDGGISHLPLQDFQKWLAHAMQDDDQMVVQQAALTINGKRN